MQASTPTYAHTHACTHTHMHARTHTSMHAYMYTHTGTVFCFDSPIQNYLSVLQNTPLFMDYIILLIYCILKDLSTNNHCVRNNFEYLLYNLVPQSIPECHIIAIRISHVTGLLNFYSVWSMYACSIYMHTYVYVFVCVSVCVRACVSHCL